jgi:hypothetical protein
MTRDIICVKLCEITAIRNYDSGVIWNEIKNIL